MTANSFVAWKFAREGTITANEHFEQAGFPLQGDSARDTPICPYMDVANYTRVSLLQIQLRLPLVSESMKVGPQDNVVNYNQNQQALKSSKKTELDENLDIVNHWGICAHKKLILLTFGLLLISLQNIVIVWLRPFLFCKNQKISCEHWLFLSSSSIF